MTTIDRGCINSAGGTSIYAQVEFLNGGDVDHRCMAIAYTKKQEVCMWACRGVPQPKDDC